MVSYLSSRYAFEIKRKVTVERSNVAGSLIGSVLLQKEIWSPPADHHNVRTVPFQCIDHLEQHRKADFSLVPLIFSHCQYLSTLSRIAVACSSPLPLYLNRSR